MMKYIHRYDDKDERNKAFKAFKINRSKQRYKHLIHNDDGDIVEQPCTKYVAHAEQISRRSNKPKLY